MSNVKIEGNASGTGTFTIAAPNSNTDRTLTLPDEAGTVLTSASSITQNAGPAFFAYRNSDYSLTDNVVTKLPLGLELFDTDSCYDTSNSRFTPNVEGYYFVEALVYIAAQTIYDADVWLYKNGSNFIHLGSLYSADFLPNDIGTLGSSTLVYMNGTTDYLEVYVRIDNDGCCNRILNSNNYSPRFSGFLARSV